MMHHQNDDKQREVAADVVVVGGGLAGTSAAIVLGHAGYSVAVIDTHSIYPKEFRAEKLGDPHLALIDRLGLGSITRGACTPVDQIDVHRFGRLVASEGRREYGFLYSDLVNALRAAVPSSVTMAFGRVKETSVSDDRQSVTLVDGRVYTGRLLVIATGLGDIIRRGVGIERIEVHRALSLSLGFDLAEPASSYPFQTLTSYGRRRSDRIAYLTLFPVNDTMRANLFVYRDPGEAWTKAFRRDPQAMLRDMMPELDAECRGFGVRGPVELRPIDLITTRNHRRAGVVLLGDAFATTCPIPGYGIQRVLTDVERLCRVHAPNWFTTPGMGVEKITQFYDDPVKRAMDAAATRASLYSRALVVENGATWTLRRARNMIVRRGLHEATRFMGMSRPSIGGAMSAGPSPSHR